MRWRISHEFIVTHHFCWHPHRRCLTVKTHALKGFLGHIVTVAHKLAEFGSIIRRQYIIIPNLCPTVPTWFLWILILFSVMASQCLIFPSLFHLWGLVAVLIHTSTFLIYLWFLRANASHFYLYIQFLIKKYLFYKI